MVIPSLMKLEHEILAFFRFYLNPESSDKVRQGTIRTIISDIPCVFAFSTSLECIVIGAYCTFPEFENSSHGIIQRLEDRHLLEGAPYIQTFLMPDMVMVRDHDYVPMVKEMLGLDIPD